MKWLRRWVFGRAVTAETETLRPAWEAARQGLREATDSARPIAAEFEQHAAPLAEMARRLASIGPPPSKDER